MGFSCLLFKDCCTIIIFQCFHCLGLSICLLPHFSILGFDWFIFCLLRHYTISSRLTLFHYLYVTSVLCYQLQLSPLLYVTSLHLLFHQVFHCFIIFFTLTVLFSAFIVPSSVCDVSHYTISSNLQLLHC